MTRLIKELTDSIQGDIMMGVVAERATGPEVEKMHLICTVGIVHLPEKVKGPYIIQIKHGI